MSYSKGIGGRKRARMGGVVSSVEKHVRRTQDFLYLLNMMEMFVTQFQVD